MSGNQVDPQVSFGIPIPVFITPLPQTHPLIIRPIRAVWVLAHTAAPLSPLTISPPTQAREIPTCWHALSIASRSRQSDRSGGPEDDVLFPAAELLW